MNRTTGPCGSLAAQIVEGGSVESGTCGEHGMASLARGDWSECIDRLYESVGREDQLAQALGAFMPHFGARGVTFLTTPDPRTQRSSHIGAIGVSNESLLAYHSHFHAYDEWVKAVWARNGFFLGAAYRGSELVDPAALRQTYFWHGFLARDGAADIATALAEVPDEAGVASFITFHRHEDQPLFTDDDVQRLRELAPHLRRTLRLHRRLAPALSLGATLRELLHTLDVPMFFVDRDGALVEHNPAALSALEAPGARLALRAGKVQVDAGSGWAPLGDWLPRLAETDPPTLEIGLRGTPGAAEKLEVRGVHGAITDRIASHATLAVCTLRRQVTAPDALLRARFGLTPTEASVALRIAEGRTVADVAHALGVGVTTVRTHLHKLLAKTGAARQAQLVAIVLACIAGSGAD